MWWPEKETSFEEITNTVIFSKLLVEKYGADAEKDQFQELKDGIKLYPSTHFSQDLPRNFVTHHFSGSWHGNWSNLEDGYKALVNTYGILKLVQDIPDAKKHIKDVVYNQKKIDIDNVLEQIPLRYILEFVKKKLISKITKR